MGCSHRRRGRDETVLSRRVGGVNKPLRLLSSQNTCTLECHRAIKSILSTLQDSRRNESAYIEDAEI